MVQAVSLGRPQDLNDIKLNLERLRLIPYKVIRSLDQTTDL